MLRDLSFENCGPSLAGNLTTLFNSTWPLLTSVSLGNCSLNSSDLSTLRDCLSTERNGNLPKLTSLALCAREEGLRIILQSSLQNIEKLTLHDIDREVYECIATTINAGKVPNLTHLSVSFLEVSSETTHNSEVVRTSLRFPALKHLTLNRFVSSPSDVNTVASNARNSEVTELDISHSSRLTGALSVMFRQHFPSLTSLVLSDCGLNCDDLDSLAQASSEDGLSELKHLDVSDNEAITGHLRHLFSFGQKWGGLLSLNVKQAVAVNEFKELAHAARLGALAKLQSLTLTADNRDFDPSNYIQLRWSSVESLDVHCAHRHGSSDHVQLYQQLNDLMEKDVFLNLNSLSVASQIIAKYAANRDKISVSDLQEASVEAVYFQQLLDISCSQMTTHLPSDGSHLKYILGLMNVNMALNNTLKATTSNFGNISTKIFGLFADHGNDMVGTALTAELHRRDMSHEERVQSHFFFAGLLGSRELTEVMHLMQCLLDWCQMSDRERSCWESLGEVVIANVQEFISGKAVDLQPVCSALHNCIDISPNISELDRSLLKSLAEITCKNLQLAFNGQQLDLQPVCPLLQDWINRSQYIPDRFRPLLKSIVKAIESVLTGNQPGLQSAHYEIHEWVDKAPDRSASQRSLFRFIADVFCASLKCFFTKPLDLESVRSLVFEWVEHPPKGFSVLCQSPGIQFLFKCFVDVLCTVVESFCNERSDTDPVSTVVEKWLERITDLLESNLTLSRDIAFFIYSTIQPLLMKPLRMSDESLTFTSPGNSRISKIFHDYPVKLQSTQATHQKNLSTLRGLKHGLRKRGIRVYEHYLPVVK